MNHLDPVRDGPSAAPAPAAPAAVAPAPAAPSRPAPLPGSGRAPVEFLALLITGILFTRTFLAEAYIVPTGSMAPTLLGTHDTFRCPSCTIQYTLGRDEQGARGRPVCPNCGAEGNASAALSEHGDRLLVHKFVYDLRPPRRWEAAVFQNPGESDQAYVKRIVGLPGESILLRGGDVHVDGRIARKTLAEQRAVRVLVYDQTHVPADAARFPRWRQRLGRFAPGGWLLDRRAPVRPPRPEAADQVDWLDYRHWQADRGGYGPVDDFLGYNSADLPGENRVDDLMIEAALAASGEVEALALRLTNRADRFLVMIPLGPTGAVQVHRNGRALPVVVDPEVSARLAAAPEEGLRRLKVEASVIDRRLTVAIDGRLLFPPYDYDDPRPGPTAFDSPVGIGVQGPGEAALESFRLWRDVYYTDSLAGLPRAPFAVGRPYDLGPGEYFMLGDNSPVSNDSRFWANSPVVRREAFLGKPFLVHLPSRAVPLQVFGRELCWIPDPWEIRYIH